MQPQDFIMMPIPAKTFTAVCALLGGALVVAKGSTTEEAEAREIPVVKSVSTVLDDPLNIPAVSEAAVAESVGDVEIDAHGHPWNEAMHASTKGKTKDGLWRMKVGVSRPDPLPGFPVDNGGQSGDTGTSSETPTPSATSPTATDQGSGQPATSAAEDDEFAAFREAAAASSAADEAAAASVPARQFSDADLGALCNQAAVKLGDPSPIKEIIARFVPEGQVAHSRNIPTERRDEFAKEVEAKAGIQFAG